MNEQPLVPQSEGAQAAPPTRIEGGLREESAALLVAAPLNGARIGIKQPRFAVTPAKLQDAALFRWKSAALVGLLFAACGFAVAWLTYVPKYATAASMRLESGEKRLLANNEERHTNHQDEFRKEQSYMIRSRKVLNEVLKKDNVRTLPSIRKLKEPVLWLEKQLQANFIKDTSIFQVSLTGEEPEDIAILVNEVINVFKVQFVFEAKAEKDQRYLLITNAIDVAEKKIDQRKADLKNLTIVLKTGDSQTLTQRQRIKLEQFVLMNKELYDLAAEIRRTESKLSVLKDELEAHDKLQPSAALVEQVVEGFPEVQKLQAGLQALLVRIQENKKVVTSTSLSLAKYYEEAKVAESNLQKMKIDLQPEAVKKIHSDSRRQHLFEKDQAIRKLEVIKKDRAELQRIAGSLGDEADQIGNGLLDLNDFRAQIKETYAILNELLVKRERLDFEKLNNLPTISSESPAVVPTVNQASFPTTAGMYSLAGFLLGLLGVSFLEARGGRVHKPTEVQRDLGIDTLGTVPALNLRGRAYGRTPTAGNVPPTDLFTEAFNGLCATLLCDDRLKSKTVLMLTSASENEGKTLLAAQLAIGFARAGRKTLLLDCDFRNARCHEQVGVPAGPGLSEVLRGEAELADVLQPLPGQAHFLSAGDSDIEVVQSLSNGRFAALLARLRADFDCIIIDSAPTLVVSDGLLIGKMVDGVILVVRSKISKAPNVFSAYEQLLNLNIRILGAVVNGAKTRTSSYYAR